MLLSLIISACSKTEQSQTVPAYGRTEIDKQAISQILGTTNKENQKTMYRALNHFEKNHIWQQKFDNYRSNMELTQEQDEFIKFVTNQLSPQLFEKGSAAALQLNEKEIREKAINLFGVNEAAFIFADLALVSNDDPSSLMAVGCKCSTRSDWCATYMNCRLLEPCEPQDGCGFLWQSRCNGMCSIFGEEPF